MIQVVECSGDPRQQGRDQGLATRSAIQARVAKAGLETGRLPFATLRALTSGPVLGRGPGREIIRHYTHLAERMAGVARGADTPLASLVKLFLLATSPGPRGAELLAPAVAVAGIESRAEGVQQLVRTLPRIPLPGSEWVVRRSHPDVGFRSVEVTLPWLASAVAGVNEAGVSAAIVPRPAGAGAGGAATSAPGAVLLVQECLQRFESLEGCLDWCMKRPTAGAASIVLADDTGESAVVVITGSDRRVLRAEQGVVAEGMRSEDRAEVVKRYQESGELSLPTVTRDDRSPVAATPPALTGPKGVWIDLPRRCLRVGSGGPQTDTSGEEFGVL